MNASVEPAAGSVASAAGSGPTGRPRRVFLALSLPAAARREAARYSASLLDKHAASLRRVDPAAYHLTVHFFGDLMPGELERAQLLCARLAGDAVAPIRCAFAGLAALPAHGPARVVHVMFGPGRAELLAFLRRARAATEAHGFPVAWRAPLPHVTVARVRRGRPWRMAEQVAWVGAPFLFDRLVLFESHLDRAGARYEPLETRLLSAG